MNKEYCIYMHKNKINNKVYIGQTKNLSRRFRNGQGYIKCTAFWSAIQKYGWDNFEHIILKDSLSLEEANQLEKEYIALYDSTNPNKGYNIALGGKGFSAFSSEIISQKNKERWEKGIYDDVKNKVYAIELDMFFESALEAERQVGVDNSTIDKVCKNILKYAGFTQDGYPIHWVFESELSKEKIIELYSKKEVLKGIKIPLYCIELDEYFIGGTAEVREKYKIDPSQIRRVIRGEAKSAGKHPITKEPLHWIERPDLITTKNKTNINRISLEENSYLAGA